MPAEGLLINSVDISNDGQRILAGTYYRAYGGNETFGVYCYDASGDPVHAEVISAQQGVYWVAISGDGNYAAAGGAISDTQGFICAYDAQSWQPVIAQVSTPARVNRVDLSHDGSVLAAGSAHSVYIATRTGGTFAAPAVFPVDSDAVSVAVSPNGKYVVAVTYSSTVYLFVNNGGTFTQKQAYGYPLSNTSGHSVSFSSDGQWFATAHGGEQHTGSFLLFNTLAFAGTGVSAWRSPVQQGGSVYSVALAMRLGAHVPVVAATVNGDGTGAVVLVETSAAEPSVVWTFNTVKPPNCVAMNPIGSSIVIADGYPENTPGNFYLLDGAGVCQWTSPSGNMNWPIAIAAGNNAVAAGSDDGKVYFFAP